jgi:predicted transcriptional regulator
MKEDEASGWRKRQVNEVYEKIRNDTLEEVALEIEKMKAFGPDTLGSFAVVIRSMKR